MASPASVRAQPQAQQFSHKSILSHTNVSTLNASYVDENNPGPPITCVGSSGKLVGSQSIQHKHYQPNLKSITQSLVSRKPQLSDNLDSTDDECQIQHLKSITQSLVSRKPQLSDNLDSTDDECQIQHFQSITQSSVSRSFQLSDNLDSTDDDCNIPTVKSITQPPINYLPVKQPVVKLSDNLDSDINDVRTSPGSLQLPGSQLTGSPEVPGILLRGSPLPGSRSENRGSSIPPRTDQAPVCQIPRIFHGFQQHHAMQIQSYWLFTHQVISMIFKFPRIS